MSDAAPAGGSSRGASTDPDEIHPDAIDQHIHEKKNMSNGVQPATTEKHHDGHHREPARTEDKHHSKEAPKPSTRNHGKYLV